MRKAKERIWRYFALRQCSLAFIVDAPVDQDHGQDGFRPSRGVTEFADREALIGVLADLRDPRKQVEEGINLSFKTLDEEASDGPGDWE